MKKFDEINKEKKGWLLLAGGLMKEIWDNKRDNKVWSKHL